MSTGDQLVKLAMQHVGEKYDFGANVPLDQKDYSGPWDCAEFASWLVFQVSNEVVGCSDNGAELKKVEPYSGAWARDADHSRHKMTVEKAAKIRGAILVRKPRNDKPGHVSISRGDGTTIEAMDTAHGVAVGKVLGRKWDICFEVVGASH